MSKYTNIAKIGCVLLALTGMAYAQTTTLSVAVGPEASLTVNTGTTALANSGGNFGTDFTGTTSLTYKVRTTKTSGSATLSSKVSADFTGAGGPSVTTPPSTGDALTFTATVSTPGTAVTGSLPSSTSTTTLFGNFGAGVSSSKAGNAASVAWNLTNDPAYATGTYSATVLFTIAAL